VNYNQGAMDEIANEIRSHRARLDRHKNITQFEIENAYREGLGQKPFTKDEFDAIKQYGTDVHEDKLKSHRHYDTAGNPRPLGTQRYEPSKKTTGDLSQAEIDDLLKEMKAIRAQEEAEYLKNVKPADAGKEVIREATQEAPNPPTPPNLNQGHVHNPPSGGGGGHVPSGGGSTHTPIIASGGGGGGGSYHAPNIANKAKPTGYNKYLIGGGIAAGLGGAAYLYNRHRNQDKRR
jgi:hypothetical protein